jgi:DNA excision repair protein ERCC-4
MSHTRRRGAEPTGTRWPAGCGVVHRQSRPAKSRPRILIDSREQTPLEFSAEVDVETVTLETGDYSLVGFTDSVRVERKSKSDLVACVGPERERFLEQMTRLANYRVRALVVEASWEELAAGVYRSNMNPRSVTGTLLALVVDSGIPVLLVGSAKEAGEAVERIMLRIAKNGVGVAA